jgi:hypothetical protein
MRTVRPLLLAVIPVAAAVLACGLVACSSSSDGPGPLGTAGNQDLQCMPAKVREPDTFGLEILRNSGHDAIVIDRVELASARHLVITGTYLVPGAAGVGALAGFPPSARQVEDPYWPQRGTPGDYRVPPRHWVNVVVGLERTAKVGSTAGIEVAYHQGSNHYLLKTDLKVVIETKCF